MARHAQAQLRSRIESVQADIHGLPDRTYRKFVRNCARERFDQAKQVGMPVMVVICSACEPTEWSAALNSLALQCPIGC